MDKKASGAIGVIAVILAIVLIGYFIIDIAARGCSSNKDCQEDSYCGADNECHQYPPKVIVRENNFLPAALVLGACIIAAAVILRYQKKVQKKEKREEHHAPEEHDGH